MPKQFSIHRPIVTGQKVLTWFCVYPFDGVTQRQKILYFSFTFIFHICLVCGEIASAIFFMRFVSIDLELCFYAIFQIAAITCIILMLMVAFLSRFKLKRLFKNLEKIYKWSKYCMKKNLHSMGRTMDRLVLFETFLIQMKLICSKININ